MNLSPLVSVVIPAYNAEAFIKQALNSAIHQTYKNIEILVVDDGSQDRTAEIVEQIAQTDSRVFLFRQANQGVAAARNLAIFKARGEFIAPLDADDIWYPEKLQKQVQCMLKAEPSVGLVYAWSLFLDHESLPTGGYSTDTIEAEAFYSLLYGNFVGNASVPLIRRECFEQVGYYNDLLRAQNAQGCEDWDLYLRVAERYQFRVVPEFLIGYRQNSQGMSINYQTMEKSFQIVMSDVWQRHPEVSTDFYQQACSNFYRYLGGLGYRHGNHLSAMFWLYKTLRLDLQMFRLESAYLLRLYKVSKIFCMSFVKFMTRPISALVWRNHESWLQARRWLRLKPGTPQVPAYLKRHKVSAATPAPVTRSGVAVREVHLEQIELGLKDVQGYREALVVFRLQGAVVGQACLPVENGCVSAQQLRASLPAVAWPVWLHKVAQEPEPTQPLPTASIVVCTRDRTEDLAGCLPQLERFAAQGHDVIVVDNCPSDNSTAQLVARYPTIRYIHEPRPGLDIARNRGIQAAKGEIVAFTDDDAQVDAGWLAALQRNFFDPMVAVATGITMPLELETDAQLWFEQTDGFGRGFVRKEFDVSNLSPLAAGRVGAGVNMAIRRSAIAHIGWFDEALDCGTLSRSGGDQEFFYRTLARGYRIAYEPSALVWHRHRRDWEGLRRCLYGYGVGVFAWWTRTLLVEKEWILLKIAPSWFWQHHVMNLFRAILRRPKHVPLDLAWAEFSGALVGPISYLRARRIAAQQVDSTTPTTAAIAPAISQALEEAL